MPGQRQRGALTTRSALRPAPCSLLTPALRLSCQRWRCAGSEVLCWGVWLSDALKMCLSFNLVILVLRKSLDSIQTMYIYMYIYTYTDITHTYFIF